MSTKFTRERIHPQHELQELVKATLAQHSFLLGRRVSFYLNDCDVVLRGVVSSYYDKQMAQESLRSIEGLRGITNKIKVVAG